MSNAHRERIGVHWSFRAIAVVGLVFNIAGIVNFLTQMNADAVAAMPEAYRTIVESRPAWATGAFALAVFGGGLGCLLLLFRKKFAFFVFIASLVGAVATQIPFPGMPEFPVEALIGGLVQVVVTAFLTWYSRWAGRRAWLS